MVIMLNPLDRRVTFFKGPITNTKNPEYTSLRDILDRIRHVNYQQQIDRLRKVVANYKLYASPEKALITFGKDKDKLDYFVTSCTVSHREDDEPDTSIRNNEHITAYNGLYMMDLDFGAELRKKGDKKSIIEKIADPELCEQTKILIADCMPEVLAAFESPSQNGLKVIVLGPVAKDEAEFVQAFDAIREYAHLATGYLPDVAGASTPCYMSWDPDPYINLNAKEYQVELNRHGVVSAIDSVTGSVAEQYDKFVADHSNIVTELLKDKGWTNVLHGTKASKYWRRPGKDEGHSATFGKCASDNVPLFYAFSSATEVAPLKPRQAYGPFHLMRLLQCNGDTQAAIKAACELLGIEVPTAADTTPSDDVHPEKPWPTLDPKAMHGLAGRVVERIGPHTESDPVALLIQFLAFFGNSIGRMAYYLQEADKHFLNIFCVLIGTSSKARKGTSASQILRLFRIAFSDNQGHFVPDAWHRGNIGRGLSSGEGLIWAVRDAIEKQNPVKEKGKETRYETVIADKGVSDKRLLVLESEFASVLRVIERDGNTLPDIIRDAWDHGDLRTMTKNSPAKATNAHISIVGHITSMELRARLGDVQMSNGFANRFIFVAVKRSQMLPDGGTIGDKELSNLAGDLKDAIDNAKLTTRMTRTAGARELWHQVYPELSSAKPGVFGSLTSRAEAQVLRLSCLYALLDRSKEIDTPHVEAALALWRYSEDSVRYVFGNNTGNEVADKILAFVKVNPNGVSLKDIQIHFNKRLKTSDRKAAIDELRELDLIRIEQRKGSGRAASIIFPTDPLVRLVHNSSQVPQSRNDNKTNNLPDSSLSSLSSHIEQNEYEDVEQMPLGVKSDDRCSECGTGYLSVDEEGNLGCSICGVLF